MQLTINLYRNPKVHRKKKRAVHIRLTPVVPPFGKRVTCTQKH